MQLLKLCFESNHIFATNQIFNFVGGLNVFIGENNTGKSFVLRNSLTWLKSFDSRNEVIQFPITKSVKRNRNFFPSIYQDLCSIVGAKVSFEIRVSQLLPEVSLEEEILCFDLGTEKVYSERISEGHKKIGTLAALIDCGAIVPGSILFWEHPETNLHPNAVIKLAKILWLLAASGVQIFMSTHDWLLSNEISLFQEYEIEPKAQTKFFSLYREIDSSQNSPVLVEEGNTLAQIRHNSIIDAHASHYDHEREYFALALNRDLKK